MSCFCGRWLFDWRVAYHAGARSKLNKCSLDWPRFASEGLRELFTTWTALYWACHCMQCWMQSLEKCRYKRCSTSPNSSVPTTRCRHWPNQWFVLGLSRNETATTQPNKSTIYAANMPPHPSQPIRIPSGGRYRQLSPFPAHRCCVFAEAICFLVNRTPRAAPCRGRSARRKFTGCPKRTPP